MKQCIGLLLNYFSFSYLLIFQNFFWTLLFPEMTMRTKKYFLVEAMLNELKTTMSQKRFCSYLGLEYFNEKYLVFDTFFIMMQRVRQYIYNLIIWVVEFCLCNYKKKKIAGWVLSIQIHDSVLIPYILVQYIRISFL